MIRCGLSFWFMRKDKLQRQRQHLICAVYYFRCRYHSASHSLNSLIDLVVLRLRPSYLSRKSIFPSWYWWASDGVCLYSRRTLWFVEHLLRHIIVSWLFVCFFSFLPQSLFSHKRWCVFLPLSISLLSLLFLFLPSFSRYLQYMTTSDAHTSFSNISFTVTFSTARSVCLLPCDSSFASWNHNWCSCQT